MRNGNFSSVSLPAASHPGTAEPAPQFDLPLSTLAGLRMKTNSNSKKERCMFEKRLFLR